MSSFNPNAERVIFSALNFYLQSPGRAGRLCLSNTRLCVYIYYQSCTIQHCSLTDQMLQSNPAPVSCTVIYDEMWVLLPLAGGDYDQQNALPNHPKRHQLVQPEQRSSTHEYSMEPRSKETRPFGPPHPYKCLLSIYTHPICLHWDHILY